MKNINYLSDLKIIEKYPQDVASFVYHFTTDCSNKCYDVSLELGNCFKLVKDGEELLVITLDSHGLKEGQLKVRRELNYVDDDFPDKEYNKVTENLYDIYLVDGKSDEVEDIEVEGYIPIFRGYSAYEIAVQHGFVGTEQEWLDSLKAKYKYYEEYDDYANIAVKTNILSVDEYGIIAQAPYSQITLDAGNAILRISNDEGLEYLANNGLPVVFKTNSNTFKFGSGLEYNNKEIPTVDRFKTINGETLVGYGNINVALYDQIPQVQTSYSDAVNHYINSDGYTDSNKCALSAKNTTILQGTKGTWSEGKLLFRKGRWGDDGYNTIAIPTATNEFDGLLSKEDKGKVDKIDTVEETANTAAANAAFATSKIGELYNELGSKQDKLEGFFQDGMITEIKPNDASLSYGNVMAATMGGALGYTENNRVKHMLLVGPNGVFADDKEVAVKDDLNVKQDTLVSGTNIKTINGDSILGSGDLVIKSGEGKVKDVKVDDISVLDTDGIANIELAPINNRVKAVEDKVEDLELFKFPNATIFGQPTIQQGQISNFTAENYLQFPFIVDFQNRPWQIDMAVTMGADVSGQHNILDSNFGLAFAIQNTKLVLALSYDGVAWAGAYTSSTSISPNKTYYIKISWDGTIYKVDVSEDKTTYTNFISVNSTNTLYPRTITIGKSLDNRYIWNGSINFNEAKLTISDKVVWTGMDDAGLSTRLAVNLNNLDSEGEQRIKDIASTVIPTDTNWYGTQAEFDAITEYQEGVNYYIYD